MLLINQVAKKVVIMCIAPDNYCVKKSCHQEDIEMKQGNGYWSHHRKSVHNPVTGMSRKKVVVQEKSILGPVADMRRQKVAVQELTSLLSSSSGRKPSIQSISKKGKVNTRP